MSTDWARLNYESECSSTPEMGPLEMLAFGVCAIGIMSVVLPVRAVVGVGRYAGRAIRRAYSGKKEGDKS
jgi:hypothetical protein